MNCIQADTWSAHCMYYFLVRVKGEVAQDLSMMHPFILTEFCIEECGFQSRFKFASVNQYERGGVSEELARNTMYCKNAEITFIQSKGNLYQGSGFVVRDSTGRVVLAQAMVCNPVESRFRESRIIPIVDKDFLQLSNQSRICRYITYITIVTMIKAIVMI